MDQGLFNNNKIKLIKILLTLVLVVIFLYVLELVFNKVAGSRKEPITPPSLEKQLNSAPGGNVVRMKDLETFSTTNRDDFIKRSGVGEKELNLIESSVKVIK